MNRTGPCHHVDVDDAQIAAAALLMQPGDVPEITLADLAAPPPAWHAQAACRDSGATSLFFISRGGDQLPGRVLCARCPVRAECLDYALADPSLVGTWGGTSESERRIMRHRAAA